MTLRGFFIWPFDDGAACVVSALLYPVMHKFALKYLATVLLLSLFSTSLLLGDVVIRTTPDGQHTLLRNGVPYLVKGANWPIAATIDEFLSAGGNSVRSYGDDIEWLLPLARHHGLSVMFGLHLERERLGFDYSDATAVAAQRERILSTVRRYKDAPEILFWAIGNEPELAAQNTVPLWQEVNHLARLIRAEDPHRPIITVVAGFDERKIKELLQHCPDLDALGVNYYGSATDWPARLHAYGWTKPYLHTEFGPAGYWDGGGSLGNTSWGAHIEQTSTEKAALYAENWRHAVIAQPGRSLGGYAFVWYWKQERTHTWFSMFLPTGERTATVDAMRLAWTGLPHPLPAPSIDAFAVPAPVDALAPGQSVEVTLRWSCPRPAKLTVGLREETTAQVLGGDAESRTAELPAPVWANTSEGLTFTAPMTPGTYRMFFYVTTADATAATANLPFRVVAPGAHASP